MRRWYRPRMPDDEAEATTPAGPDTPSDPLAHLEPDDADLAARREKYSQANVVKYVGAGILMAIFYVFNLVVDSIVWLKLAASVVFLAYLVWLYLFLRQAARVPSGSARPAQP